MRIKFQVEIELGSGMQLKEEDERIWAENEVLIGDGSLILHSNEIGDEVGIVKKVGKVIWIDDKNGKYP